MRSGNLALNANTFAGLRPLVGESTMTLQGTVVKTGLLLLILTTTAGWTWGRFYQSGGDPGTTWMPMMLGAFGGLVVALITAFKKDWSPISAPIYAALEGLFLGGLSSLLEASYPGIVIQAVGLTFGTLAALLAAYASGTIRPSENFKLGLVAATGGICLVYVVSMVLGIFGVRMAFLHGSGLIGIGFSLVVVVIAALNLVLDFDFIENGAERGAPKYMEWYGAFGLMVTLIWLYIEILHLLMKLRDRD